MQYNIFITTQKNEFMNLLFNVQNIVRNFKHLTTNHVYNFIVQLPFTSKYEEIYTLFVVILILF